MSQDPMYPAGVSDNDPHFTDESDPFDPVYEDLCYQHIRAENE